MNTTCLQNQDGLEMIIIVLLIIRSWAYCFLGLEFFALFVVTFLFVFALSTIKNAQSHVNKLEVI